MVNLSKFTENVMKHLVNVTPNWCSVSFTPLPQKMVFISINEEEDMFYDCFVEDLSL
jgi:hypothetical protein